MEELEVKVMSLKFAFQIVSPTSKGAFFCTVFFHAFGLGLFGSG